MCACCYLSSYEETNCRDNSVYTCNIECSYFSSFSQKCGDIKVTRSAVGLSVRILILTITFELLGRAFNFHKNIPYDVCFCSYQKFSPHDFDHDLRLTYLKI